MLWLLLVFLSVYSACQQQVLVRLNLKREPKEVSDHETLAMAWIELFLLIRTLYTLL